MHFVEELLDHRYDGVAIFVQVSGQPNRDSRSPTDMWAERALTAQTDSGGGNWTSCDRCLHKLT